MLESKALLSSKVFHANLLSLSKIQTIVKSHSLMPRGSNLFILMFYTCFFISGILKVAAHNFMRSRSHDGLAAKGQLQ